MYVQAEYRGIPENLYKPRNSREFVQAEEFRRICTSRGIPENLYKPRSPGEFVKTEVFLKICA